MLRLLLASLILTGFAPALERSPVVKESSSPVRVLRKPDGRLFADFGKAAFGTLEIDCPRVAAGGSLVVHLGEALSGPDQLDVKPVGSVRYQRHEVRIRPGSTVRPTLTWSPPGWMKEGWLGLPKGMPEVMPFRYVEIENAPASIDGTALRRISLAVPFDEEAASFRSSDPRLDAVWELCRHSIKATTFLGLYVDGDRERKPYEADVLINQLSHYGVDSRYDIARLTHEYLLEKPTWPTEWRLQSVIIAWNDFLWSGDDASLRRNYEVLKSRAMISRRTADGWFLGWKSGEPCDIVDWPACERDGYDMEMPVKTVVTAFHYRALVLLEKIARHLGKEADAGEFARLAEVTRRAVNEKLWDAGRGCYVDGMDPASGKRSSNASAHASFFPLALGLVPEDRVKPVASFLKGRGMACSVYGAQFLLEALYEAGEADHALGLMVSNSSRSWRNMTEKVGSTITLEAWDPKFKPNLDWNHAWGTAPGNVIPRCLMGIEPLEPGFRKFRVRPQTSTLESAEIKMPTPLGPIQLAVKGRTKAEWRARIEVPRGAAAEFHVPYEGTPVVEGPGGAVETPRVLWVRKGRAGVDLMPGIWTLRCSTE